MAINYITKDGSKFDQKLVQGLITKELETTGVELVAGGKSFTLTTISTSGYKPHTRNKGFNEGSYSNEKEVYTMTQDRDVEFYIDSMDVDETNRDLEVGRISRTFIEEQAQPDVDAYRFSKLATRAIENKNNAKEQLTVENVYSRLKEAILPIRKFGAGNIIVYMSSEAMDLLERSKEFTRNITNQNVGQTALESRITSLDGVTLKEVWDIDRFNTEFDFSDGFKPTGDQINFLVVAKPAQISVAKHNAIFLFEPGKHTQGDGYLYQNRLYHDTFVLKEQKEGVYVSVLGDPNEVPGG
jgi:hypothetical protein